MKTTVYDSIAKIIDMPYVKDSFDESSLCFINHNELRHEFKAYFTKNDLVNYVYGVIYQLYWKENEKLKTITSLKIPYPIDAAFFWDCAVVGKEFRIKHFIHDLEFGAICSLNW